MVPRVGKVKIRSPDQPQTRLPPLCPNVGIVPAGPSFSIVMPVLDRAGMIAAALDSLASQTVPGGLECIVVDGGSTDGTREIAAAYHFVRVLTGPDAGLYDAIDKGIAHARGDLVGLLNSDDIYLPGALETVAAAFAGTDADSVCGGAREAVADPGGAGRVLRVWNEDAIKRLDYDTACSGAPIINARFFRRDWLATVGPFGTALRIAADRAWLIRCLRLGMRTALVPDCLYEYRVHAGSLTFRPEGRVGPATLDEYLGLSRSLLADPAAPSELRLAAMRWHGRDLALRIAADVRSGHPVAAIGRAISGLRTDPLWPLAAARRLAVRGARVSP